MRDGCKGRHQLDTPRRNFYVVIFVARLASGWVYVGRDLHVVIALPPARLGDVVNGHVAVDTAELSAVDQISVRRDRKRVTTEVAEKALGVGLVAV